MKTTATISLLAMCIASAFSLVVMSDGVAHTATRSITLPSVPVDLKPGEGRDKTENYCIICHSLDYITMQPRLTAAQWTATVNKMIKVYGAPIQDDDAKVISRYLTGQYGSEK